MAIFELHPQLAADCIVLGSFKLNLLLLLNDAQYPWFVLVPQRPLLSELYQLDIADAEQFWRESRELSQSLMSVFAGDKLNVAALGNMVPQLHVHHIVRFKTDVAWPKPVWGMHPAVALSQHEIAQRCDRLRPVLRDFHWQR